jgi:hypothetical protein
MNAPAPRLPRPPPGSRNEPAASTRSSARSSTTSERSSPSAARSGSSRPGYNYLVPVLPIVLVAPRYFAGEIAFGVVTQSAMAFAQVLGAFSIVVVQFQSISAVVRRLGSLWDAMNGVAGRRPDGGSDVDTASASVSVSWGPSAHHDP